MRCKLGFTQNDVGKLLVLMELLTPTKRTLALTVTKFSDENVFLYYVVLADLEDEATTSILSNVLLVLSDRPQLAAWTELEASERQLRAMGLEVPCGEKKEELHDVCGFLNDSDLQALFTQAPTPLTLLVGPQHRVAFINPAYLRMLGGRRRECVLGKTVREVMPELEGQPFLDLLDNVYRTGEAFVGTEVQAHILRGDALKTEERYFDFVYHPVRDRQGDVCGVLCQASDVTDRVLARQVSEARELQLYRQWAELEALYKGAPIGMTLVDVKEYRFVRINDVAVKRLGISAHDLVGRRVFDVFPEFAALRDIYTRVAAGEEIRHVEVYMVGAGPGGETRRLLICFSPVLDACGCVEAIASLAIDTAEIMQPAEDATFRLDVTWSGTRARHRWQ
jgi:PAS domain S-box-containing protein